MKYAIRGFQSYAIDKDGNENLLANFTATIVRETRFVDGRTTKTVLTITGEQPDATKEEPADEKPILLPAVEVDAESFAGLAWVMPAWGVQAVIRPGAGVKEDLRTCMQISSRPEIRTIYKTIGWTTIGNKRAYLHATGAITAKGNDPTIEVRLPAELSRFDLSSDAEPFDAIKKTLSLIGLTKGEVTWPLLAATLCPLYGPCDFAVHLTGRTGTYKSELLSLFQSHYGSGMDARHLPGSWSSTPNALEAQCFFAANAPFVIDDFVPTGTSWQVRAYQTTADKIVRSQGNQAGRARLTDASNLQTTMYPRGIVLSTGEDTPEGHSVRARLLILELSPGDIEPNKLTAAQQNRPAFPATIATFVQWLAENPIDIGDQAAAIRDSMLDVGHSRTPAMLGRLIAAVQTFLEWAELIGALTPKIGKKLAAEANVAIRKAGDQQTSYLEASDPCDIFLAAIRQAVALGTGHFRTYNGGIPLNPTTLGWTSEVGVGEMPTFKSRGPLLGWVDWNNNELLLDITAGYNIIRKVAGNEVSLTKQTMLKRLKDTGMLARSDEARQRNSIRVTAEGHARQVIALVLSMCLDTQESPNESE